jgi:hypothetical protein
MSEEDMRLAYKNDPHMPRSRAKLAIPFVSKDVPSPASEFAQPDVVIGLTALGYRIQGMRFADFLEALEKLVQVHRLAMSPLAAPRSPRQHARCSPCASWLRQ